MQTRGERGAVDARDAGGVRLRQALPGDEPQRLAVALGQPGERSEYGVLLGQALRRVAAGGAGSAPARASLAPARAVERRWLASLRRATPYSQGCGSSGTPSSLCQHTVKVPLARSSAVAGSVRRARKRTTAP